MTSEQKDVAQIEIGLSVALLEPEHSLEFFLSGGKLGLTQIDGPQVVVRGIKLRGQLQRGLEVPDGVVALAVRLALDPFFKFLDHLPGEMFLVFRKIGQIRILSCRCRRLISSRGSLRSKPDG